MPSSPAHPGCCYQLYPHFAVAASIEVMGVVAGGVILRYRSSSGNGLGHVHGRQHNMLHDHPRRLLEWAHSSGHRCRVLDI